MWNRHHHSHGYYKQAGWENPVAYGTGSFQDRSLRGGELSR